jgi:hypothetical protein
MLLAACGSSSNKNEQALKKLKENLRNSGTTTSTTAPDGHDKPIGSACSSAELFAGNFDDNTVQAKVSLLKVDDPLPATIDMAGKHLVGIQLHIENERTGDYRPFLDDSVRLIGDSGVYKPSLGGATSSPDYSTDIDRDISILGRSDLTTGLTFWVDDGVTLTEVIYTGYSGNGTAGYLKLCGSDVDVTAKRSSAEVLAQNQDGTAEKIRVTLKQIIDPATVSLAGYREQPSTRSVGVVLTIENIGRAPLVGVSQNLAQVLDNEGHVWRSNGYPIQESAPFAGPRIDLEPGASVTGAFAVPLPTDLEPVALQYSPIANNIIAVQTATLSL